MGVLWWRQKKMFTLVKVKPNNERLPGRLVYRLMTMFLVVSWYSCFFSSHVWEWGQCSSRSYNWIKGFVGTTWCYLALLKASELMANKKVKQAADLWYTDESKAVYKLDKLILCGYWPMKYKNPFLYSFLWIQGLYCVPRNKAKSS